MRSLRPYVRPLSRLLSGTAGLALVVAFIVLISTMPPLQVQQSSATLTGYQFKIDTAIWGARLDYYWQSVRTGTLGLTPQGQPAAPLILLAMGHSLLLLSISLTLAVLLGGIKGFWDFHQMRKKGLALGPLLTGAIGGLPDFWLILVVQYVGVQVYTRWGWRPFSIAYTPSDPVTGMVYPIFCTMLVPMAYIARITCTAMTNVYDREYVRTARAKGLHELRVIYKHVLRGALVQILDALPGIMTVFFSSLLVVEYAFNYPGITTMLKEAILPSFLNQRRVLQGGFLGSTLTSVPILVTAGLVLGLLFWMVTSAVAILRRLSDPRLKERDDL